LLVEQAANGTDGEHVFTLVIAAVAAALDRLQLREFLLPVAQHMRLDRAQLADLTDGEIAFAGNRRQLVIVGRFQHRLPPALSVSDQAGKSPPDERKWE